MSFNFRSRNIRNIASVLYREYREHIEPIKLKFRETMAKHYAYLRFENLFVSCMNIFRLDPCLPLNIDHMMM